MMIVGRNESRRLATTRRVRNVDPKTPMRLSANSFSKFRANTNVSATNKRKTSTDTEAKNSSCWFVSGFKNGKSKDVCGRMTAKTSTTPMDRRMTAFLRLNVFSFSGLRVGEVADSFSSCPLISGGLPDSDAHIIRDLREGRRTSMSTQYLVSSGRYRCLPEYMSTGMNLR